MYSKDDSYKLLECITITGVFQDPSDLSNYTNCCDCSIEDSPCYNEITDEYPLQPHYIDVIREEIVKDILRTKQVKEDNTNDSID